MIEGKNMRRIREAVHQGKIEEPFSPNDIDGLLGIDYASTFLPRHAVGNPGQETEKFVRVGSKGSRPALYRLKTSAVVS